MTPAVFAATKAAKVEKPLPYLFACALVANAASFVLPISNPANLVLFDAHLPPLREWLRLFALPALLAIAATGGALFLVTRRDLAGTVREPGKRAGLSAPGKLALGGIGLAVVVLLTASAFRVALGAPTWGWVSWCWRSSLSRTGRRSGKRPGAFRGASCRWWPGCSSWWRPSTGSARSQGAAARLPPWGNCRPGRAIWPERSASRPFQRRQQPAFRAHRRHGGRAGPRARIPAQCPAHRVDLGPNVSVTGSLATVALVDRLAPRRAAGQRVVVFEDRPAVTPGRWRRPYWLRRFSTAHVEPTSGVTRQTDFFTGKEPAAFPASSATPPYPPHPTSSNHPSCNRASIFSSSSAASSRPWAAP